MLNVQRKRLIESEVYEENVSYVINCVYASLRTDQNEIFIMIYKTYWGKYVCFSSSYYSYFIHVLWSSAIFLYYRRCFIYALNFHVVIFNIIRNSMQCRNVYILKFPIYANVTIHERIVRCLAEKERRSSFSKKTKKWKKDKRRRNNQRQTICSNTNTTSSINQYSYYTY